MSSLPSGNLFVDVSRICLFVTDSVVEFLGDVAG